MSKQPTNKFNKLVATAAGAAVVVSAIAPVAGAEWTNTPNWMKDSLQDLINYGVIDADSTVNAAGEVTRGEVALYFARALKLDMENVENPGFADVPTTHEHYKAIAALAKAGKMNGTEKGFEPDRVINRAEMASLIVKAFGYEYGNGANLKFTDLKGADWARNAIAGLTDAGIKLGVSDTKFAPLSKLTRQDTVGFLWKVMKAQGINFGEITEVVNPAVVTVNQGSTLELPKTVEVMYNNDTKGTANVEWNTEKVNMDVPGTYTVEGDVEGTDLTATIKVEVKAIDAKVVNVEAKDLKTIVVEFNQPMDKDTATTKANYQLNNAALAAGDTIELSDDKKSAIITLATALTNKTYVTLSISENDAIESATDKTVENIVKSIYVNDTVKPEVSSKEYVAADNELVIEFTEEVEGGTVVVKDENGVAQTVSSTLTGKTMTVDTTSLTDEDMTYTFTLVGAKDLAANYFANNKVEFTFTVGSDDEDAPEVKAIKAIAKDKIEVTFNEKLSVVGTLNGENLVKDSKLDTNYDYTVDETGKVYTIKVDNLTNERFNAFAFAGQKDLAGNTIKAVTKQVAYEDAAAATIVKTTAKNKVVTIEFNEDVVQTGTAKLVAPNQVVKTIADADITVVDDNKIEVDLNNYVTDILEGTYTIEFGKDAVKDEDGNTKEYKVNFNLNKSSDTQKPVVETVELNTTNDTVEVTFSEAMGASALDVENYTVDGEEVFNKAIFKESTNTVVLELKKNVFEFDAARLFEIKNVKDEAGNVTNDYKEEITFEDNTAPTLIEAKLAEDGKTVTLKFNEVVSKVDDSDFEVEVGGKIEGTTAVGSAREIVLTFSTPLSPSKAAQTITVKATDDLDITDVKGNEFVFVSKVVTK